MITIVSEIVQHKEKQVLLLKFPYDLPLIALVKGLPGVTWSKSKKAWYCTYTDEIIEQVIQLTKGIATVDLSCLTEKPQEDNHREEPKDKLYTLVLPQDQDRATEHLLKKGNANLTNKISPKENIQNPAKTQIEKFKSWMYSRRYSENTISVYTDAIKTFLKFYSNKPVSDITNNDIVDFNNNYILANNYSASFQNQVINAIKLFFKIIQNTSIDIELIHRPKRQKQLPNVLSKEEVKRILDAPLFLKHRAMLSLIYSCGLRCGELLRLKPEHVDSKRNVLIIKQSKGRKDRIAPLSDKTISLLRDYYKMFKPKTYLFEGEKIGTPYTERSLQNVLKQSISKAGINKPVTLHWLRHSYATHLLEGGTDLRYIQEILGHSSSRTTEIYTHVSTKSIQKIVSPFDTL